MSNQTMLIHYKTNGREGYTKCGINTKSGLLIADGTLRITFKLSEVTCEKCLIIIKQGAYYD